MKRIRFLLLLLGAALAAHAQTAEKSFYISVLDPSFVPEVSGPARPYAINFSNQPQLNAWVSQYGISDFRRAFRASRLHHLKQVYFVTCTDSTLMDALQSTYPDAFAGGWEDRDAQLLATTPNDYGNNVSSVFVNPYVDFNDPVCPAGNAQTYLRLIGARNAWDYDIGTSAQTPTPVTVGMVDGFVWKQHPDLTGKVSTSTTYPNTILPSSDTGHGTKVAGLIAGATNNGKGLAAIGWNSLVINSSGLKDSTNLLMSKDGIRIINNSWAEVVYGAGAPIDTVWNNRQRPEIQDLYNEVYENGTFVVCGAGNGPQTQIGYYAPSNTIRYPASWDHNFSVTSVGHFDDTQATYNLNYYSNHFNVKDVHLRSYTAPTPGVPVYYASHQHNSRVDLCAPGYGMTTLGYSYTNPTDTLRHYANDQDGTSFAAPLVSGTAALMLHRSINQCLTPYQLEYLLKTSAQNISNISANKMYAGKLGAGRLNAEAALAPLATANGFNCNGTVATTMKVVGVDITTRCLNTTSGLYPKLTPFVVAGTINLTGYTSLSYRWMALPGNNCILDDSTAWQPKVVSTSNTAAPLCYYLLTVTEAGAVPRVASQRVYFKLNSAANTWDLTIKDSPFDLTNDTNTQATIDPRDFDIWGSSDMWNRRQFDVNGMSFDHQNPEFYKDSTSPGQPNNYNYLHVRIKNVGCVASPAPQASPTNNKRLRLYWTLASFGENWPADWTTNTDVFLGVIQPVGKQFTTGTGINIPSIPAGRDTILRVPWKGVNAKLYDSAQYPTVHACVLARIEEASSFPFGMYVPELQNVNVTPNVIRNNNIATRNMDLYNSNPNNITSPNGPGGAPAMVYVSNAEAYTQVFSLDVRNDKATFRHLHGDLSEYITGTLYLGDLWDVWAAGGRQGSGFGKVDSRARTITYDPSSVLRLDNLEIPGGKKFRIALQLLQRDDAQIYNPVTDHVFMRQLLPGAGLDGDDYVYGAFGLQLDLEPNARAPQKELPTLAHGSADADFTVYPNPAHDFITVQRLLPGDAGATVRLLDVTGRQVRMTGLPAGDESVQLPLQDLSAGLYLVEVQSKTSAHRYKVILR